MINLKDFVVVSGDNLAVGAISETVDSGTVLMRVARDGLVPVVVRLGEPLPRGFDVVDLENSQARFFDYGSGHVLVEPRSIAPKGDKFAPGRAFKDGAICGFTARCESSPIYVTLAGEELEALSSIAALFDKWELHVGEDDNRRVVASSQPLQSGPDWAPKASRSARVI